ncbi:hypothetical protein AX17_001561 [Amanita inopinata Kibby_2008]|nr:hypothetical protein AX17_001561 [Amanita inopinata Kibby_2008]
MGFTRLRVGHKRPHLNRRADDACSKGGFTNPTVGQTIDSTKPLDISWDTTCLSADTVDIILSAPGNDKPLLQGWQSVKFATGHHVVDLQPRKWNSTSSQQLQLSMYQSNTPSFLSPLPAGPVFTASYDPQKDGQDIKSETSSKMTHGKTAAAVLMPLIIIACIGVAVYVKMQRRRVKEERKRWSEMVDKRMSTISTDWKSISVAGAQAAIRNSIAVNARNSAFSFGGIRPTSIAEPTTPDMAQVRRPGIGLRNAAFANTAPVERVSRVSFADTTRVSRVSFADHPRPSTDSRRTGASRTSRVMQSIYVPPVPSLPAAYSPIIKDKFTTKASDDVDGSLSPRQTAGPLTLTPEDIRARIQGNKVDSGEDDIADVLPALSMMRMGSRLSAGPNAALMPQPPVGVKDDADEYIFPPSNSGGFITMPEPMHFSESDVSSAAPSFPVPMHVPPDGVISSLPTPGAAYMSPDDMLRAYAERKAANSSPSPLSRVERHASMNGFVGGFATALGKIGKKKEGKVHGHAGAASGLSISHPMPIPEAAPFDLPSAVHTGGVGVGAYGGAQYTIEEDEEEPYGGTG